MDWAMGKNLWEGTDLMKDWRDRSDALGCSPLMLQRVPSAISMQAAYNIRNVRKNIQDSDKKIGNISRGWYCTVETTRAAIRPPYTYTSFFPGIDVVTRRKLCWFLKGTCKNIEPRCNVQLCPKKLKLQEKGTHVFSVSLLKLILPHLRTCTAFDWQVNMLTATLTVQNIGIYIVKNSSSWLRKKLCRILLKKKIIRYPITAFVDGTWGYTFFHNTKCLPNSTH